jgi:hypothetical protein
VQDNLSAVNLFLGLGQLVSIFGLLVLLELCGNALYVQVVVAHRVPPLISDLLEEDVQYFI